MSAIPTTRNNGNPAAIMHQLLTAGTVLASYTDMPRMLEFAAAALERIPGVARCVVVTEPATPGFATSACPVYEVVAETVNASYGRVALEVQDESLFQPYAAAVHNIAGLVAMRLESSAHEQEMQDQIREKTRELQSSLEERETLLKEIHHRVKNNLNVVESLLNLQFGSIDNEAVQKGLSDSVKRVRSMSIVHKLLYQSKTLDGIGFGSFVAHVVDEAKMSLRSDSRMTILKNIADIPVSIDIAVPVALIVNELFTNAVKYAFPNDRTGTVRIIAEPATEGSGHIIVEDDGVGLPDGFSLETADTLGMQLVYALTGQIGGQLEVHGPPGTRFVLRLP